MSPNIVAIGMLGRLRAAGWPVPALAGGAEEELNLTSARERDTARIGLASMRAEEQGKPKAPTCVSRRWSGGKSRRTTGV